MLIPSAVWNDAVSDASLSRRVNANSQPVKGQFNSIYKLIKKGEC